MGDLAEVADHHREKLIRRHPHVFGDIAAEGAADVVQNWHQIKRGERGGSIFGELPESLPATLYAAKLQSRAERSVRGVERSATAALAAVAARARVGPGSDREQALAGIGAILFDAVAAARAMGVDPEVALRRTATTFRDEIEREQQP